MKCFIIFAILAVLALSSNQPFNNPYKENKSVGHSLYREKDDGLERISGYHQAVPEPIKEIIKEKEKIIEPEKLIALRIVEQYRKQFDYLDSKQVDDMLSPEELSIAFKDFGWPKIDETIIDPIDYAKVLIQKYDENQKGSINFVEFCKLVEDLWNGADMIQEQNCNIAFNKSKEVFDKLFNWLDRDGDSFISPEDMIFGISRMMIRDADIEEIGKVFAKYDPKKTGRLNKDSFNLAVINGLLDKTFSDSTYKETYIK